MKINFRRNFELKDNGDLTQNLYSKCYQNNLLISETDLGNIEDIVCLKKENKELKEKLEKKNKVIERTRKRLGDFADEMVDNGNAYAICVDVLDILNKGVDE